MVLFVHPANQLKAAYLGPKLEIPFRAFGHAYRATFNKQLKIFEGRRYVTTYARKLPNAWRIEAGDIDHVGHPSLLIGVKKSTWNIPKPHTTLFVLGFDGHEVFRKWTGSTMGRPLIDFCVGHDQLYTLEAMRDGQIELAANIWTGFGFRKGVRLGHWPKATHLLYQNKRLTLRVFENYRWLNKSIPAL